MNWKPEKLTREQMAERREAGVRLLEKGKLRQAEIARQLGVSAAAVCVWAKKLSKYGKESFATQQSQRTSIQSDAKREKQIAQ